MSTLPEEFTTYTEALMGKERFACLCKAMGESAPVSIRLNPEKCASPVIPLRRTTVPWCKHGVYLSERPPFTFDPLLHAGLYYVQEAASMFISQVVKQYIKEPVLMLDLCAAPGGKSTCLRGELPKGSLLVSNEPMAQRASILKENIVKWGHPDCIVTNNYPRDFSSLLLQFDAILADVPCSGEGMFRKDEEAINQWSTLNVDRCRQLQRSIIADIWDNLKPGGLLIYSTCTFNSKEDEENAAWIAEEMGADLLPIDIEDDWNITGSLTTPMPVCRFIPGVSESEGLFIAIMRKKGKEESKKEKKNKKDRSRKPASKLSNTLLKEQDTFAIYQEGDELLAIPKRWVDVYEKFIKSKLNILYAGVELGSVKGHDLIPSTSLALSSAFREEAYPHVELNLDQARTFLRREPVLLPMGTPRGYVVMTYKGKTLGFEKNLGNRANNLYPQAWRIKSSHNPENERTIIEI